ncbi:hypothetical protein NEOC65_002331 [Neochlamydia sp. AcF65]|nr:hypothetical protein [Neochlamydia sp. AcF65]
MKEAEFLTLLKPGCFDENYLINTLPSNPLK